MKYPRIVLAGAYSGAGKTTLALGIMLALRRRGLKVQPFKAGPDYIDPSYHDQVSQRKSRNLDTHLCSPKTVISLFTQGAQDADISLIEGVMGLYDGFKDTEQGSTAHLAKLLKAPVILVLNAASFSRSGAAVVLGYKEFDRKVDLRGVILNNIKSANHYAHIKNSIEKKIKLPVLGYLPKDPGLKLPERHLGLIPAQEKELTKVFFKRLLRLTEENIDIEEIIKLGRKAKPLAQSSRRIFKTAAAKKTVTIAIAQDKAFNFYYQDNLDILERLGAKFIEFSPLSDRKLPENIDGIYIGGGFPELYAKRLSANTSLKKDILAKAVSGIPVYAECAGMMYLLKRIKDFKGRTFSMVGLFKQTAVMGDKLKALGYVNITTLKDNILSKKGEMNKGHVFHWSYIDGLNHNGHFAFKLNKDKKHYSYDGLMKKNVLASYAHLHFASNINLAKNLVRACANYRRSQ